MKQTAAPAWLLLALFRGWLTAEKLKWVGYAKLSSVRPGHIVLKGRGKGGARRGS